MEARGFVDSGVRSSRNLARRPEQAGIGCGFGLAWPNAGQQGSTTSANLVPTRRRQRVKARTRKSPTSKYSKNSTQHPSTAQRYTLGVEIMVMEQGWKARSKR